MMLIKLKTIVLLLIITLQINTYLKTDGFYVSPEQIPFSEDTLIKLTFLIEQLKNNYSQEKIIRMLAVRLNTTPEKIINALKNLANSTPILSGNLNGLPDNNLELKSEKENMLGQFITKNFKIILITTLALYFVYNINTSLFERNSNLRDSNRRNINKLFGENERLREFIEKVLKPMMATTAELIVLIKGHVQETEEQRAMVERAEEIVSRARKQLPRKKHHPEHNPRLKELQRQFDSAMRRTEIVIDRRGSTLWNRIFG
ncbi:hypothetical protein KAW80_04610 [Candidatus Babeliales bacterium]|nr:hypothetical protein [Candidatus Babeliales bacterium]